MTDGISKANKDSKEAKEHNFTSNMLYEQSEEYRKIIDDAMTLRTQIFLAQKRLQKLENKHQSMVDDYIKNNK